jgi:hypothetical protein
MKMDFENDLERVTGGLKKINLSNIEKGLYFQRFVCEKLRKLEFRVMITTNELKEMDEYRRNE